jgi:hypothetical protein
VDRLTRLLGGVREPFEDHGYSYYYIYLIALIGVAIEAARRWRRRSTQVPRRSRKVRYFVINWFL